MNDDLHFQLRASWREFDVPDSEQASELFEAHSRRGREDQSLVDQAKGIVMSTHGIDGHTAQQLLMHVADSSHMTLPELARAVVGVATRSNERLNARAEQVATGLVSGPAAGEPREVPTADRDPRLIDLRNPASTPPVAGAG